MHVFTHYMCIGMEGRLKLVLFDLVMNSIICDLRQSYAMLVLSDPVVETGQFLVELKEKRNNRHLPHSPSCKISHSTHAHKEKLPFFSGVTMSDIPV